MNLFKRCLQRKLLSLILIGLIAEGFIGFIDITRVFGQPSITLKWIANAGTSSTWMGPLVADLNNDGLMEIVITGENGAAALDPINGSVIWSVPYGGDHVPCEIIDLNKDGIPEILMGPQHINGSSGGVLALHGNNGSVYWYNPNAACKGTFIAVADINADGYPEIYSATPGKVTALTYDGSIFASTYTYYPCWGGLTIGDTDFDGVFEVYLGERSDSYPSYPSGGRGLRAFWADNLTEIWAHTDILCSSQAPVLDDVDKDGDLEIIILDQSPAGIAVINTDGSVNTYGGIYRKQSISGLQTHSNPPVADLDGDGNLELITCGTASKTFTPPKIWDLVDWKLDATLPFEGNQPPGVADVDGDEKLEIIAPNQQNVTIFKYNPATQNYDIIYTIPIAIAHPFSIAQDIDNDGKLELVFDLQNHWVYVYDVEAPAPTPKPRSGLYFYSQYRTRVPVYVPPPEQPPKIAEISPSDGTKNVSVSLSQLSFKLTDYQNDPMNYTVTTNPNIGSDSGINVPNGEVTIPVSGLANSTAYTWTVTATDGTHTTTRTLAFYTPWIIDSDPPTHDAPLLVSSHGANMTDEELICYNQTTTDPEGDEVTNIYHWIRDGNSITNLLMPFDTNSSTTAPWEPEKCMDNSGYGNDGTVFGATWTSDGVVGGAYEFDGNDVIEIPDDPSLGGTDDWSEITVEFWIRPSALVRGTRIISRARPGSTGCYMVGFQTSAPDPYNTLFWGIDSVTEGWVDISNSPDWDPVNDGLVLEVGQWYHIFCTYQSGPGLTIYVNGLERFNMPLTGNLDYRTGQSLFLGYDGGGSWYRYLQGTLDEMRIYPKALTPAQAFQRYLETKDGFTSNSTIVPQETTAGEVWTCEVIPNDSWQDGTAKTSNPLTVLAASGNSRPRIDLYTPTDTTPEVYEVESLNFTHTSSDPDGDPLSYSWLLDSGIEADTQNWNYSPGYGDAGTHNITLIVSDGALSDSQQWNVTVIRQYELFIGVIGNGTTTPTPGTHIFAADTELDLTAIADPNWAFLEWSGDLTGSENPTTIIMDGNKTVTATFIQEEYTLMINVFGNGSVTSNASAPYYYGDVVELTAVPDLGWKFFEWSVDLTGSTNPDVITMDSDKTVNATFTLNEPPTIDSYYPQSNPNISEGESQLFNITYSDPDGDSLTVQWYLNGTPASTLDNYTFTSDYDSAGVYNVTVVVSDGLNQTSHEWTLAVLDVNRSPTIDDYYPLADPNISEGESQLFNVTYHDPDGNPVSVQWYLNGSLVGSDDNYTYTADYDSAGVYNVTVVVSDGFAEDSYEWILTVSDVNRPPEIDSHTPLDPEPTVDEASSLNFTHTSSDPDGDPLSYSWLLDDVEQATSQNWTYMPSYEDAGTHNVTLVVSDGELSDSQQWNVTVANVNRVPIIDTYYPSTNPTITEENYQLFNVTYHDPDGDNVTIQWYLNVSLVSSSNNYTFTADYDSAGVYNVTVVVSDGLNQTSHEWILTVLDVNRAPTIDSYTPIDPEPTVDEGASLNFTQISSDPDNDTLSYSWLLDSVEQADTQNWTYTPGYEDAGTYNVTLVVSDGKLTDSQQWNVTVNNVNRAPTIETYYPPTNPTIFEGESQVFNVTYSDLDGDILTVQWYLNGSLVGSDDNYTYTADYDSAGVYNVTVVVSDGLADMSHEWNLTMLNVNRVPVIDSFYPLTDPAISEEEIQEFNITYSDPDDDPLTVEWYLNGSPVGSTDNYTFTADYTSAGTYNVTVVISDGLAETSHEWTLTVLDVNRSPTIDSYYPLIDPTISEGESQLFNVTHSDPDGDLLTVQWLLNGTLVGSADNYTFTADYDSAGTHNVTVVVSDGLDQTSHEWTLTVLDVNRPPTIDSYTPANLEPTVDEGDSLNFTHTYSDPDGDPLTYSWLLDNVTQTTTQNWTYTPGYEDSGLHNVTLVVSDGELTDLQQWNVTVLDVNRPPVIDDYYPATDPTISEDESQVFNVTYSDPDGDLVMVQWYLNGTPTVTNDNYTFTAGYDDAGVYNVTVVVSDGLAEASHEWTLTILDVNRAPTIETYYPPTNPTIFEAESQEFNVTYSDPDGDALTVKWFLNGSLVGSFNNYTFNADYDSAGTYNITVVVSDGLAETSHEWMLTVTNVNRSPTIDSYSPVDLEPEVDEGESLNFTHTSSDPDIDPLSYSWLLDGDEKATNQNWTYTPSYEEAGTHNVTLVVSDSGGLFDSQQWNVTVNDINRLPVIDSFYPPADPIILEGESQKFNITKSDLDGDPLTVTWWLNQSDTGETSDSYTYTANYESAGTYNVTVVVSDGFSQTSYQWMLTVTNVERDIAITNLTLSKNVVGEGYALSINVTITNQGELAETFNVTVYANTTIIDTLTNITLTSGNSTTVTFTWNTTGFAYGNYTVSAVADAVPGEADTTDNTYINGVVLVTIAGDFDGDGDVDMFDFNAFAQVYATSLGDPEYRSECDFDGDGDVDMFDFDIFTQNYGKTV